METHGRSAYTKLRLVYLAAAGVPFLALAAVVGRHGYDFPYWDAWNLVPLLEKSYDGGLDFRDFWAPLNEHRLVAPYAMMVGLARLTHWNHYCEMALSLALGFAAYCVLLHQVSRTAQRLRLEGLYRLSPLLSIMLFSLVQWECWLLGWHFFVFLTIYAVVHGIVLLAAPSPTWWRWSTAAFLGVVATFSQGNGLVFWLIGLLVLFLVPAETRKTQIGRVTGWIALTVVVFWAYFYGPGKDGASVPIGQALSRPLRYVNYVLVYLGASVVNFSANAHAIAGALGLFTWAGLLAWLNRKGCVPLRDVAPYIAFGLYALGAACLSGLARVSRFGALQATSSRYTSFSVWLWVAIAILLALAGALRLAGLRRAGARRGTALATVLPLAMVTGLFLASSARSYLYFTQKEPLLARARAELFTMQDTALLARVHPDIERAAEDVAVLKKHRLSIFRNGPVHNTEGPPEVCDAVPQGAEGAILTSDGGT